ncbi:GNAT family N-acetyltransferase [Quadrisphaera setariae]|uniref:N-acetyltransferase domain-containing protein n=1 Tax=Quadrisphaera setariae TaxID=2593304 RepID=A0A5C8ZDZ9_9ACTN|nr:hypothetical protein [Quadrisphaera setariae]TXR56037.1 hypothetical protein FMM08_11325 [Quadrisphaera setariae]
MSAETVMTRVPTLRAAAPLAAPEQAPSAALLAQPWTFLAGGQRLVVRPARVQDLPVLASLLVRCSPTTRLGWSGRGGTVLPLVQQEAWLREPGAVVVESGPGRAVAVGALRPATCTGEEDPIAMAAEVLVQDSWQHRGIGSTLLAHFAGALLVQGRTELQVHPDADPVAAQALLSGLGGRVRGQRHAHGRCPRVHVPRTAVDSLGPLRELSYR